MPQSCDARASTRSYKPRPKAGVSRLIRATFGQLPSLPTWLKGTFLLLSADWEFRVDLRRQSWADGRGWCPRGRRLVSKPRRAAVSAAHEPTHAVRAIA